MNVAFKEPAQPVRSLDSIAEALLLPTGIDGVYARTAIFEQVVGGLTALISRYCEPDTEVLRFPPVMSRRQVEKSGYLKSFPHFLGCVSCLGGAETEIKSAVERSEAGEDWTQALAAADLVLSPAACYPVYPLVASRRKISTACSRSACANMSASARPKRSMNSAAPGWRGRRALPNNWACRGASIPRAIRSSAAAAS